MVGGGDLCALTRFPANDFTRSNAFHQVWGQERLLEMVPFTQVAPTLSFAPVDPRDEVLYGVASNGIVC